MRIIATFVLSVALGVCPSFAETVSERAVAFASAFRQAEPFLLQTIAVSDPAEDGGRVFLLTEPPANAYTTRDAWLAKIFGDRLSTTAVLQHPIGFDGFVRDIVVETEPMMDGEVAEAVEQIHEAYFGTGYKASYRAFVPKSWNAARMATRREGPPNLEISASSLHDWLYGQAALRFSSDILDLQAPVATAARVEDLNTGVFGVYYSNPAGIVLLVVPRKLPLNEAIPKLRRFVIDTDALLGAVTVREEDWLILVGRERTTQPDEMEPLRVDTILTLASSRQTNLAQSYERNAPLAGKVTDPNLISALHRPIDNGLDAILLQRPEGGAGPVAVTSPLFAWRALRAAVDWAPILLSRELTHTEYGQLLNITDQMLKGWSMGNAVDYARFHYPSPYGNPDAMGLFGRLQKELGGFNELTFNWNTAGFGAWTDFGKIRIFSLFRTGALPVSYLPEGSGLALNEPSEAAVKRAEDDYWSFFANLREPYLARAAQYAALHVIFTAVPVEARRTEPLVPESAYAARWAKLTNSVAEALAKMAAHASAGTHPHDGVSRDTVDILLVLDGETSCVNRPDAAARFRAGTEAEAVKAALRDNPDPNALAASLTDMRSADEKLQTEGQELDRRVKAHSIEVRNYNRRAQSCQLMPNLTSNLLTCDATQLVAERGRIELDGSQLDRAIAAYNSRYQTFENLLAEAPNLIQQLMAFGDCRQASQAVVDGVHVQDDNVFRTPGIVVSADAVNIGMYGGHNLDGRSVEIVTDGAVLAGKVQIDAEAGIIRLNPADVSKGGSAVRAFERDYKRYRAGDPAFRDRVLRRVEAALVQDRRAMQAFDALAQVRPADALVGQRGMVIPANARSIATRVSGPHAIRLDAVKARELADFADKSGGQAVIRQLPDGTTELSLPNGRPPIALLSRTREELQDAVETMVAYAARSAGKDGGTVRFIDFDGTLSMGDMAAIKYSAIGRPSAGSGGSGGLPPSGGIRGILFDAGEPPRGFNGGGNDNAGPPSGAGMGRNTFDRLMAGFVSRRGDPWRRLTRIDADWSKATVDAVEIGGGAGRSNTLSATLTIPFKAQSSPSLRARLSVLFTGRKPNEADVVAFTGAVDTLRAQPDELQLWRQLESIRINFQKTIEDGNNVELKWHLQNSVDDIFVVEKDSARAVLVASINE